MIRLAADEDLDSHIVRALRHRLRNVDIVRVQEAELAGIADEHVLAWTAETERVLVSHDASTMTAAAYARIEGGAPTPGLIIVLGHPGTLVIERCAEMHALRRPRRAGRRLPRSACGRLRSGPPSCQKWQSDCPLLAELER